ncbi:MULTISPECIES: cytochrome c biogenesis CcdA family protein [unclassified Marinobacterium]|uniref:cytochrome c biogenesis CcdA family protein n=1 Tax=unclassified Marinobacterium TaxID=2644139 RepID=UPI001567D2C4|nr:MULTISPECIES: cytochrome c biogenesis protein CcdA [unclassified Marinobacterium]NRP47787.1 thiol:disulfide interchange protein precursor [Marinobacterium sp. xm-d-543]NRP94406.1 thiol:disulfide interchange protein precursor [Marinobacterium sp. xm-g-59]NRQ24026.1 thiol:disulfide interchange protein precursor [Marinobacterium sp. xm-m-312]
MEALNQLGLLAAFTGGLISFLSPCTLPLVPGYLSFVAGANNKSSTEHHWPHMLLSLFFVMGFSIVFVSLGASTSFLGMLLTEYRYEANIVGGGLVIIFGLFMAGVLKINWLYRDLRIHPAIRSSNPTTAFLLGISFALGWTPCIGPILAVILTLSSINADPQAAVLLLTFYALGLAIPFLLVAMFMGAFKKRMTKLSRFSRQLHVTAGITMVIMGIAMVTGRLTLFAVWMMDAFPVLDTLG